MVIAVGEETTARSVVDEIGLIVFIRKAGMDGLELKLSRRVNGIRLLGIIGSSTVCGLQTL